MQTRSETGLVYFTLSTFVRIESATIMESLLNKAHKNKCLEVSGIITIKAT